MITGSLAPDALRDERKKHGYTQKQIADLLGIDRSTYSYYEIGRLQVPHDVLLKLADYYSMPVSMFFTESSDDLLFHSDFSFQAPFAPSHAGDSSQKGGVALTFEEKQFLSQIRAKSCGADENDVTPLFEPMEFEDDALLAFLVDPDDT